MTRAAVTAEELSDDDVRALSRHVPSGDPLHDDIRWYFASYVPRQNKRAARARIAAAINTRGGAR